MLDRRPVRLGHREPVPIGLEAPFEHERRLVFLGGNEPDHVLAQPARQRVGRQDVSETMLVVVTDQFVKFVCWGRIFSFGYRVIASMPTRRGGYPGADRTNIDRAQGRSRHVCQRDVFQGMQKSPG